MLRNIFLLCCLFTAIARPENLPPVAEQKLALEIFKEMIESKSGFDTGPTTPIAESVAARFKAEGFPESDIFVGGAIPTKMNLVVRRVTGSAPVPGAVQKQLELHAHNLGVLALMVADEGLTPECVYFTDEIGVSRGCAVSLS